MARDKITTTKLLATCEPVVAGAGYELVDILYKREQHGWVVRVFIDRPGGVGFDDCEAVSRELSAVLDVADPVAQAYTLEVSSPGISRPLRTAAHFRDQLGHTAKIALGRGVGGRRNFTGTLVAVESAAVVVDVDGTEFRLPLDDIDSANLVPNWDEVMKRG